MDNETIKFLDSVRTKIGLGENLPYQYHEQIYIAWVEKKITLEEMHARIADMPHSPILMNN